LTTTLDEVEGCYGGVSWACGRGDIGSIGLRGRGREGDQESSGYGELVGTYHKLYIVVKYLVSYCYNNHSFNKEETEDIPIIPPRAQLTKYLPELGSIFPKGSLRSCKAIFLVRSSYFKISDYPLSTRNA
jgi:hypothetical protein